MIVNTPFILNDAPYGTERSYNGLRLAPALGKLESETVRVFLLGDAVACAKAGQTVPGVTTTPVTWCAWSVARSPYAAPAWTHGASATARWSRMPAAAR